MSLTSVSLGSVQVARTKFTFTIFSQYRFQIPSQEGNIQNFPGRTCPQTPLNVLPQTL